MSAVTCATTDLCDANEALIASGELRIVPPGLLGFGGRVSFHGQAATIKTFEDNSRVAEAVREPGLGRVLVVDGGGSVGCALLGGNLAAIAAGNGWAGVVIDGAARDRAEIDACALGVRALALHPKRSQKRNAGEREVVVSIRGVAVRPGEWIYADLDGVIVCSVALHAPA